MTSVTNTAASLAPLASVDTALVRAKQGLQSTKIDPAKMKEIDATAKEFESMFIAQMIQPMFEGLSADPAFGGGEAEDTWKGMMIEQYGHKLAEAGGFGLSDSIRAAMIQMQETQQQQGNAQ
ncbi:MAG: rod-binding protein [Rhodospirillales bacterium]|nr:rod-binding protein [Alphaproteobacteria bacterium]MCB9987129.1 rod-binding protein [Rhodospirillales bacterium]USO08113.1 MAG: rod-binding protein [Rhodospirillales bacterium]